VLQIREERKKELEEHVLAVKRAMEAVNGIENPAGAMGSDDSGDDSNEEWTGFTDDPTDSRKDAEYIDEDQYATVTVEAVDISKDGFTVHNEDESEEEDVAEVVAAAVKDVTVAEAAKLSGEGKKRVWSKDKPLGLRKPSKKKREKKFRYESKTERKVNRDKQRVKNRAQAQVRKEKAGK
jgi:ribosomal RNA-processing protein 17